MNCDSLTLTGNPPNQVLTCNIGSAAPSGCSIQGPSSGVIGTPITLTAVCSVGTAPLTYTWSGGSAAICGNQACSVSDSATTTYTVGIANGQGSATPSPTKQVTWSNTPIAPSGCALNASTISLPVGGGSVSLSMDCSAGTGLNYVWTGGFAAGASTQQVSGTVAATTTFTANASNSALPNGITKSVTVTVATGGGGGPISCAGYLNTNVITMAMPIDNNRTLPMGVLDAGVVQFTPLSGNTTGQILLSTAGNNAGTHHDYTLSSQPCDFGAGIRQYVDSGAPTVRFTISQSGGIGQNLKAGNTYYINVRNSDATGCGVTGQTCDLFPVSSKP